MFGALTSLTAGGGLTGGTAGPSRSDGSIGSAGGIAPVVIGGWKSDGSAKAGPSSVPDWAIYAAAAIAVLLFARMMRGK